MEQNNLLKFDQYCIMHRGPNSFAVNPLAKGVSLLVAEALAGVDSEDFAESMAQSGWVGTCPAWVEHSPIVTVPHGTYLGAEQAAFLMEWFHGLSKKPKEGG